LTGARLGGPLPGHHRRSSLIWDLRGIRAATAFLSRPKPEMTPT
jgi:hypothetical protein